MLKEPDVTAVATHAAQRASFQLSSMVLHWGPAPSCGHYTCLARVHGGSSWCLLNDAMVTSMAEGQVGSDAHARNAYMLMFALQHDEHIDKPPTHDAM